MDAEQAGVLVNAFQLVSSLEKLAQKMIAWNWFTKKQLSGRTSFAHDNVGPRYIQVHIESVRELRACQTPGVDMQCGQIWPVLKPVFSKPCISEGGELSLHQNITSSQGHRN